MHTPKFNLPFRMTIDEVAAVLSASKASVHRWAGISIPAPVVRKHKHVRWDGLEIERYLEQREVQS